MRIWSWYNFSEYLVLQFDDFKLLMGLRIIKKKKNLKLFYSQTEYVSIFWRATMMHYWKLTINRETMLNSDMLEVD